MYIPFSVDCTMHFISTDIIKIALCSWGLLSLTSDYYLNFAVTPGPFK